MSRASRSRTSPALLPAPSASAGLVEWLAYLEALHPATIDLGLDRVAAVRDSLGLRPPFPIITVGGTKFAFEDVIDPAAVQSDINRRRAARADKKRQAEITAERERMAEWLATYHKSAQEFVDEENKKNKKPG